MLSVGDVFCSPKLCSMGHRHQECCFVCEHNVNPDSETLLHQPERECVGNSFWIKPHRLWAPAQVSNPVCPGGASIAIDFDTSINLAWILEQLLISKDGDSALIVQQQPHGRCSTSGVHVESEIVIASAVILENCGHQHLCIVVVVPGHVLIGA